MAPVMCNHMSFLLEGHGLSAKYNTLVHALPNSKVRKSYFSDTMTSTMDDRGTSSGLCLHSRYCF